MNSLEFIKKEIDVAKKQLAKYPLSKEQSDPNYKHKEADIQYIHNKYYSEQLQTLQQIKSELKLLNKLKNLINTGDIFSPSEFYDDYESCLEGDGSATFVTKDLEIIEDFEKGWKLLQKEIDKYGTFSPHKCKISFVVWFNR